MRRAAIAAGHVRALVTLMARRRRPAIAVRRSMAFDGLTQYGSAAASIPATVGTWIQAHGIAMALWCTVPTSGALVAGIKTTSADATRALISTGLKGQSIDFRGFQAFTGAVAAPVDSAGYTLILIESVAGAPGVLTLRAHGPAGEQSATGVAQSATMSGLFLAAAAAASGLGALSITQAALVLGPTTAPIRAALYGAGLAVDWAAIAGAGAWLARFWALDEGAESGADWVVPDRGAAGLTPVSMTCVGCGAADLVDTAPTGAA